MKANFKNQINVALIIAVLTFLVLGCDAWINVKGKVSDESGNSLGDAKIVVKQSGSTLVEGKSEKDGSFSVGKSVSPLSSRFSDVRIIVSKEGYQTYEKELAKKESERPELDIILKKN